MRIGYLIWTTITPERNQMIMSVIAVNDHKPPADGVDKFADAAVRHRQAALQHLSSTGDDNDATLSSDEEDELDDDKILSQVLQTFSNTSGESNVCD